MNLLSLNFVIGSDVDDQKSLADSYEKLAICCDESAKRLMQKYQIEAAEDELVFPLSEETLESVYKVFLTLSSENTNFGYLSGKTVACLFPPKAYAKLLELRRLHDPDSSESIYQTLSLASLFSLSNAKVRCAWKELKARFLHFQ